jgi:hypothetical protein
MFKIKKRGDEKEMSRKLDEKKKEMEKEIL